MEDDKKGLNRKFWHSIKKKRRTCSTTPTAVGCRCAPRAPLWHSKMARRPAVFDGGTNIGPAQTPWTCRPPPTRRARPNLATLKKCRDSNQFKKLFLIFKILFQ